MGPRLGSLQTPPRNRHGISSNFTVIESNYSLNITLCSGTLLSYQAIQIPSHIKNIYDYLLTVYYTRNDHDQRLFCTDTFRLTIRVVVRSWRLRDIWWRHYPVRAPIRNRIRNRMISKTLYWNPVLFITPTPSFWHPLPLSAYRILHLKMNNRIPFNTSYFAH